MAGMTSVIFTKHQYNETDPILLMLLAIFGLIMLESIMYKVQRNKVKLFLSLKMSDL